MTPARPLARTIILALLLAEQVLARLEDPVLAGLRGLGGRGGLRLRLQVVEVGLAEGALDDLDVELM